MGLPTRAFTMMRSTLVAPIPTTDSPITYAAALIKFNGILCGILDRRVEPDTFLCEIPYGVYATGDRNEEHIIFVNHLQYAFYKDESDYVDRLIEEMEPEMAQRLRSLTKPTKSISGHSSNSFDSNAGARVRTFGALFP